MINPAEQQQNRSTKLSSSFDRQIGKEMMDYQKIAS